MNRTTHISVPLDRIPLFDRDFFGSSQIVSRIGDGALGGKGSGLAFISEILQERYSDHTEHAITVTVPRMVIITTALFERFIEKNNLDQLEISNLSDDQLAHEFQRSELPAEMVGDLHALIASIHTPLAIRSSSLFEDALQEPLAGVYVTKMIPNNQFDAGQRFRKLTEAIKLVYASTWLSGARRYLERIGRSHTEERMAVIIQEIVGRRFGSRFYPHISGVARSYNFYPIEPAKPEQGMVNLALGLGKTIVDGGISWHYSPAYPRVMPPVASPAELLELTQTEFWAVNMDRPTEYDPIRETEYLVQANLQDAEHDQTLQHLVSTYRPHDDRLVSGTGPDGPRCLTFAPLLQDRLLPLNDQIVELMDLCREKTGSDIEIEFAVALGDDHPEPAAFNLLQVRPMVVSDEQVEIDDREMTGDRILLASDRVLGNGIIEDIRDIVYVRPDTFEARHTSPIARDLAQIDRTLTEQNRSCLVIGFGRWGSSDPWLGIPVRWDQISNARVIVEATLPEMNVDLSQGSHFFHNLTAFEIPYFMVRHDREYLIDWEWLDCQERVAETDRVRHVRLSAPLTVKVDGRTGRGVIRK